MILRIHTSKQHQHMNKSYINNIKALKQHYDNADNDLDPYLSLKSDHKSFHSCSFYTLSQTKFSDIKSKASLPHRIQLIFSQTS